MTSKQRAIALPDDEHVAWVPDERERIRPFSTGGNYVNSQLSEDDSDRTATYSRTTGVSPRSNALPVLAYLLLRRRAQWFMPKVRDWMNAHSWVVNIIAYGIFIVLILA